MNEGFLNELYQYAFSLTNDEPLAFDLVQETLLRLMDKKDQRIKEKFFVMRCMRNLHIDTLRKDKRLHLVEDLVSDSEEYQSSEWDSLSQKSQQEKLSFSEVILQRDSLEKVLSKVTSEERELLYLKEVQELTIDEISELLGIKRGTLLSKIFRLKKTLKLLLTDQAMRGLKGGEHD